MWLFLVFKDKLTNKNLAGDQPYMVSCLQADWPIGTLHVTTSPHLQLRVDPAQTVLLGLRLPVPSPSPSTSSPRAVPPAPSADLSRPPGRPTRGQGLVSAADRVVFLCPVPFYVDSSGPWRRFVHPWNRSSCIVIFLKTQSTHFLPLLLYLFVIPYLFLSSNFDKIAKDISSKVSSFLSWFCKFFLKRQAKECTKYYKHF